ncbi:hypothetical protein DER46DRAFT_573127 [Fusarium sp. MPI-SDFR-AT-0072]|nr:hypothetical protein DER46DRAFT_573127 [Fusarium sp. MPI-SDFR-AT-0072]
MYATFTQHSTQMSHVNTDSQVTHAHVPPWMTGDVDYDTSFRIPGFRVPTIKRLYIADLTTNCSSGHLKSVQYYRFLVGGMEAVSYCVSSKELQNGNRLWSYEEATNIEFRYEEMVLIHLEY